MKALGQLPDDPLVHAAVLAYASDYTLLEPVIRRHGLTWTDRRLRPASLDHAMWFHRPVHADEWILYSQESPSASGGRGPRHRPDVRRRRHPRRDRRPGGHGPRQGVLSVSSAGPRDPGQWVVDDLRADDHAAWSRLHRGYLDFYESTRPDEVTAIVWGWLTDPAHELECLVVRKASSASEPVGIAHFRPFIRPLHGSVAVLPRRPVRRPGAPRQRSRRRAPLAGLQARARERGWTTVRWITRARTAGPVDLRPARRADRPGDLRPRRRLTHPDDCRGERRQVHAMAAQPGLVPAPRRARHSRARASRGTVQRDSARLTTTAVGAPTHDEPAGTLVEVDRRPTSRRPLLRSNSLRRNAIRSPVPREHPRVVALVAARPSRAASDGRSARPAGPARPPRPSRGPRTRAVAPR